MKNTKRSVSLLLIIASLLSLLVSCGNKTDNPEQTQGSEPPVITTEDPQAKYPLYDAVIGGEKLRECRIVIAENASDEEKKAADDIAAALLASTGSKPAVIADASAAAGGAEICIGNTNRTFPYVTNEWERYLALKGNTVYLFSADKKFYADLAAEFSEKLSDAGKLAADFVETKQTRVTLNGKRIIFIGNSQIYYSGCVTNAHDTAYTTTMDADKGTFYRMCRAHGEACRVTNATVGSSLSKDYRGDIPGRKDNLAKYDLSLFDYVVIMQTNPEADGKKYGVADNVETIAKRFTKPGCQVIFCTGHYNYTGSSSEVRSALKAVAKLDNVTVCDQGKLVYGLLTGAYKIEGSSFVYNKNTFVVNKLDTHHPNLLNGYILAEMVYDTITGMSAVGQKYDYSTDAEIKRFVTDYYNTARDSSMADILRSPSDILGIQTLIDKFTEATRGVGLPNQ